MAELKVDSTKPVRAGEELDVQRLQQYLLQHLDDVSGELSIEQFPSGWSNLTYLLKLGELELVLRRPPFGNQVKSAHDMGREYRVLSKLCKVFAPAPRPYLYCQDTDVIGDEFYVMERRRGIVIRKTPPDELVSSPATVAALCDSFIRCMADLHTLDYQAAGLGDLGRPEGYVERQVSGWIKRYEKSNTDEVPAMDELGKYLTDHMPPEKAAGLVHNDFKHDNLMLAADDLTRIIAVLDWEMATIGDPLMDLGTTLAYWVQSGDDPARQMGSFGPTTLDGTLTRRQLADRYTELTGIDIGDILFYYCFGLYKLAVIVQQIYARYVRGATQDPRFAQLNIMVASLAGSGVEAIETGDV